MSEPSGLRFDFGDSFESAAERVKDEAEERAALVKRELSYGVSFLDDICRGILPHDLILLGAETGAGKTELAKQIAMWNALHDKVVHYFALEAEPREIERRIKFAMLMTMAREDGVDIGQLNYPDWYRGNCESVVGRYNAIAESRLSRKMGNLRTYYRGSKFGHDDMKRLLLSVQKDTDLVILDHLHYVDVEDDNENRGFKAIVKMIRDTTLGMGKPMILVAHLRKKLPTKNPPIVPDLDMFHGSSDIVKICTHAVMLAPARCKPCKTPGVSNTFIHVPKDRMGGATGLVALCQFELATRTYRDVYALGRATGAGDQFEVIEDWRVPKWAKRHHRGVAAA